jgi:predicted SprT family Zn-dependent metalloprotease
MRWRRSEPDWRLLEQLEFLFASQPVAAPRGIVGQALRLPSEGGTRGPKGQSGSGRVDKILAASPPNLTSSSERPIHLRGRDDALESRARDLLRSLGAKKLARKIRVEWNPRLKTCAGRADYREKLISLNPLLRDFTDDRLHAASGDAPKLECNKHSRLTSMPAVEGPSRKLECNMHSSLTKALGAISGKRERSSVVIDEVDRTLRHELAHLLAQWRAGRRRIAPHGSEWRRACRDLAIADEARCHNLPFASRSFPPRFVYVCPNCKEKFPRVRRIRRAIACLACCRKYNRGDFDARFRLKLKTNHE